MCFFTFKFAVLFDFVFWVRVFRWFVVLDLHVVFWFACLCLWACDDLRVCFATGLFAGGSWFNGLRTTPLLDLCCEVFALTLGFGVLA